MACIRTTRSRSTASFRQWPRCRCRASRVARPASAPRARSGRAAPMSRGPAGIVESLLPLDAWTEIEAANPELQDLHPDVEALLVYRVNAARQYYIAPIDRCYALAGVLRKKWRGLSGGAEAWESIAHFFAVLDAGSAVQPVGTRHA